MKKRVEVMKGIFIGVGVGPGDPELMTIKAVRRIKENPVIAVPGREGSSSAPGVAYRIALQAVSELKQKELLVLNMPMTKDREALCREHENAAGQIENVLNTGRNVVFLTLGDPSVYSTFTYLRDIVASHGYETETVSGVTSFCAAAAQTGTALAEWNEEIHILPAMHRMQETYEFHGNTVLMKAGKNLPEMKEKLSQSGYDAVMVQNCGMENQQIYRGVKQLPDDAGYYSLIIAKPGKLS